MNVDTFYLAIVLLVAVIVVVYFVFGAFLVGAGYEPTYRGAVDRMLRLAEVSPRDTLYDLGAGTGAIVFRAARTYRARVVGIEIEPIRYLILRLRRATGPDADRIRLIRSNFHAIDLGEATVITAFLWTGAMVKLKPQFEAQLRAGTRIVSHVHPIPGWTPLLYDDETEVYLYRWDPATATRGSGTRSPP